MGPIFGGMLLSGEKVARELKNQLETKQDTEKKPELVLKFPAFLIGKEKPL